MDTNTNKPRPNDRSLKDTLVKIFLTPEIGVLIPIIILCIITTSVKPKFMTWKYISSILKGSIFIGAASLGQALVSIAGEVDLSLGYSGCFSGIMMGVACLNWGCNIWVCLLVALCAGALVGLVNGLLVTKCGLSSWITTLATQFICNGLAVTISDGVPMDISSLGASAFTRMKPLGLNWLFFIFLLLLLVCDFIVRRTKFGYKLRAVGGNANSAIMAGINVNRIRLIVFILAGIFAAVGGIFDVLDNGAAVSTFGGGREFRTIICVNIGGIAAGSGSVMGVGLGVMLFHVLWYALRIMSVDTNLQLVLIGAILVLAVLLDMYRRKYEARRIAR